MKKSLFRCLILIFSIFIISYCLTSCKKPENPIKYTYGTFPDILTNLAEINSEYDDYNLSLYQFNVDYPVIFSSNRKSSGGQFDLEQADITFTFDQTNGDFKTTAKMGNDTFTGKLINQANTSGDDFGPSRLWSDTDGLEYLMLSSVNEAGNLDMYYLKYPPVFGTSIPDIDGPHPINLLNSDSDDAYICFDSEQDSVYFTSDRDGSFDIFLHTRPPDKDLATWFNSSFTSSVKVDSVNSEDNDRFPLVFRNVMVFASNRPGGLGGYDLYFSVFKNGKWNSPVNMGPGVNSSSDECRPVIGYDHDFNNLFIMFSSNRPGGKGKYDIYFRGLGSSK